MNAKGRHIESEAELLESGVMGDWYFRLTNGSITHIFVRVPDETAEGSIAVLPIVERKSAMASWTWDGNTESPTLIPSILHRGKTEWHGFMDEGQLISI